MKRTILMILAGSLAAVTLGVTAAHAEERDERGPEVQQRHDRHDRGDEGWRYDRRQGRDEYARHDRDRDSRHGRDDDRDARVAVYDGYRGVSIDIGGFFPHR